MEKIFVSYRPVSGTNKLFYHLTLNYINKDGRHLVIDAGPSQPINDRSAFSSTLKEELLSLPWQNTDSRFGRLIRNKGSIVNGVLGKDYRITKDGNIVVPYTRIAKGKDLRELWGKFEKTAKELDGKFEYRPKTQNSNTFISQILKLNGYRKALDIPDFWPGGKPTFPLDDTANEMERISIPGSSTNPRHHIKKKVLSLLQEPPLSSTSQLEATLAGIPQHHLQQKGPERIRKDATYNPFAVDENGWKDLTGEAFMIAREPFRAKKLIRAAGREDFFKNIFDAD